VDLAELRNVSDEAFVNLRILLFRYAANRAVRVSKTDRILVEFSRHRRSDSASLVDRCNRHMQQSEDEDQCPEKT